MTPHARFDLVDYALFALGVLGLALFVWLLPGQHPDSAASYALGQEQAVAQARDFLERQGYPTDALTPTARLTRSARLLDSLQVLLGRSAAIRGLEAGEIELPAHYWTVQWQRDRAPSVFEEEQESSGRIVYEVGLTLEGAPWQFRNPQAVVPRGGVDREVLRSLLAEGSDAGGRLMASADSALGALFYFDLSSASQLADSLALLQADRARLHEAAAMGRPQGLGEAAAAAIARAHVVTTALGGLPLAVQSVEALPERGRSAARVRFASAERVHGQRVAVDVDVTAAGALLALDGVFNEEEPDTPEGNAFLMDDDDSVRDAVKLIGYIVLMLVLVGVMFRRLSARALDARAALKDALVAGLAAMVAVALHVPTFAVEMGYGWGLLLFISIAMLFTGVGLGVLVFVASSASDALARAVWPRQIATLSLVRQNAWVNQPVGRSLLRGTAAAGVLLGTATLTMTLLPKGVLHLSDPFGAEASASLFAASAAKSLWYALLLVLAAFVGVGTLLKRWRSAAVLPGLAVVLTVVGFDAPDLLVGSPWVSWGGAFVLGTLLGWVYQRYDALTVLVAVVLVGVLWDTAEGWLVAGSPGWVDALLGFTLLAGTVGLGVVGVRSGRTGEALLRYEPDYVVEQRERGRLQRELEIAREVQRSFLPVRMPDIEGLDIAARCLAAEEVGGDYYDVIPLGDRRLALVIGDVSGKGIQAAFFMTLAKGFLQTLAHETDSPAEVLRRANRLFFANAPRGTFISLIYGVFDLDARTFTFARAGHNPVILKRSPNQTADFIQPAGLAIGLTPRTVFDETIQENTIILRRGDTLVFYTDGFSEAMDPAKHLYTDERLAEAVAATSADITAADLLQALVDDVVEHAGEASQHDDMTMLVVRVGALADTNGRPITPSAESAATS